MRFYSTNNRKINRSLREAVIQGLAEDEGLFMPVHIPSFPPPFFDEIKKLSFSEIAVRTAILYFRDDIPEDELEALTRDAISFDTPLIQIQEGIFSLELFHGPTLAFKDVGARFMARLLSYFIRDYNREIHVLVATSGDTGSAVANGFWKVPGISVHILYPGGLVSPIQENQFTTLGENITALEVKGAFDDCQRLVKRAFLDKELSDRLVLTSANSINVARLLPQAFYYLNGYAQLESTDQDLFIAVPSGNFGNLTAAMIAWKTGLPVKKLIAATNVNDIVPEYLKTGHYDPRPSVPTIANAMDVGNPSNFIRILDLCNHSHAEIRKYLEGHAYTDDEIRHTIRNVYNKCSYVLDPHGATGYQALTDHLKNREKGRGIFIETAHPAKFADIVEDVIGRRINVPDSLRETMEKMPVKRTISAEYEDLKNYLLSLQ
ncbi:MAG: threonine synthase [Bacteroides sp. SM23_62_1]|nr:MAG: threonine synthase [Bacteroides sp. SM23_62_1]